MVQKPNSRDPKLSFADSPLYRDVKAYLDESMADMQQKATFQTETE